MPHVVIRALALAAMLFALFGLVWALCGNPDVAASCAGPIFSLLACVALVLGVAIVERITKDKDEGPYD